MSAKRRSARAGLPITCGELVQGTLDDAPCLVSCPIDRYHTAQVSLTGGQGLSLLAPGRSKTRAVLELAMTSWGLAGHVTVHLEGDTPVGRGYGSSTADMGAALYALAEAADLLPDPLELARLAVRVEPTDSTLFTGLALFGHRDGSLSESLGPAPSLGIVVLDPGGCVDTVAFNRVNHRAELRRLAAQHREAFDLLREGVRSSNLGAIGRAATLSATAHQGILCNPLLEPCLKWAQDVHALGICRAHSGTLLGVLLDPRQDVHQVLGYLASRVPGQVAVSPCSLTGGGAMLPDETYVAATELR
jgi:L-threonine kinase